MVDYLFGRRPNSCDSGPWRGDYLSINFSFMYPSLTYNNHTGINQSIHSLSSLLNWIKCFSLCLTLVTAFRESITRATFYLFTVRYRRRIRRRRQEGNTACATHHPTKGRLIDTPTPVVASPQPWHFYPHMFNREVLLGRS